MADGNLIRSLKLTFLLNELLDLQERFDGWRSATLKLMQIKDDPSAFKTGSAAKPGWNDEAKRRLAKAPWHEFAAGRRR